MPEQINPFQAAGLVVNVVEINPYAPRPFVFSEAALCLRDAILATGCASRLCVNEVDPRALSLVLGALPPFAPLVSQLDPRTCAIVNFEQLASNSPLAGSDYQRWLKDWVVADYHSGNIEHLKRQNGAAQQAFELPIVPGPSLVFAGGAPPPPKSVDVLFYGTLTERRAAVLRRLEAAGLTVEVVAGAYAQELAPALRRARMVLHVHYYDTGLFPVARMLQPVANGIPVVCETSVFSELSDWSRSGVLFAGYDGLADACGSLLLAPAEALERVRRSQQFARELDFATPFGQLAFALAQRAVPHQAAAHAAPPPALQVAAPRAEARDDRPLTNAEIEAILAEEAQELPPEAHLRAAPLKIAERTPGKGPYGVWIVVLLLIFSIYTIWQSMAAR